MQTLRPIRFQGKSLLRVPANRSVRLVRTNSTNASDAASTSTNGTAPSGSRRPAPSSNLSNFTFSNGNQPRPASNSSQSEYVWKTLTQTLDSAREAHRSRYEDRFKLSPEDAWKTRSVKITNSIHSAVDGAVINSRKPVNSKQFRPPINQVPTVASGRTVISSNFAQAIQRLGSILGQNKVRSEWRRDRYFEKGPAKRYRLRSERHRRRFAAMIRRYVRIVQAIKRRGM
ncbi:hypothetical protein FRC14_003296 [Serendipita sp. 396]|nr:hypothetical protein FRC14_003296 [Serendipita sp. 396]KAG8783150.1 hypothetical protein FRC15_005719 [Serendipita sp. 397]KAG8867473.1 hypothetical protein FRC20_005662 [Serendipita sp. 405]